MSTPLNGLWLACRALLATAVACATICAHAIAQSPTLVAQPAVAAPASIPELARALKYDVNLIYEHVYTNIDFTPTFGLKKDPLGTLLDGKGNSFDQSALLVALLRESGYTATFKYAYIELEVSDIVNLFGVAVDVNACPLESVLAGGAIPFVIYVDGPLNCTGTLLGADIAHTWVSVTGGSLGTATYALDPAFKTYTGSTRIDLASATGYDRSIFMASALSGSATPVPNSIQHVNKTNIAEALKGYANNLVGFIRQNDPTATTREIIGGRYVQPLTQPYVPPATRPDVSPDVPVLTWTEIPNEYRTTMRLQLGGIDKTYFADDLYGHRLSVVYNGNLPTLYLDGIVQGTGAAGASTLSYAVNFPFCFATTGPTSPDCPEGYTDILTSQNVLVVGPGYTYAIVAAWGETGRGMVEFHRRQLQENKAAGGSDTSEAVLGQGLNVLGYSLLAQGTTAAANIDEILQTRVLVHAQFGIVGQAEGPFIDMPGSRVGMAYLSNDARTAMTSFFATAAMLSALEWGVLEQNLDKAGVGAVSTVKLLDIANSQGNITFDASSGNWSSIRSAVESTYAISDLDAIDALIAAGYRVILPQRGDLAQGVWVGAGYLGIGPFVDGSRTVTYRITGNLKGGFSTDFATAFAIMPPITVTATPIDPLPQLVSNDPIDLASGAFLHSQADISIGSSAFPVSLSFRRSYNSSNLYGTGPLGPGWTHNFAATAIRNSDGLIGMGQNSPIDAAAAIAATYVIQDLLSDAGEPLNKMVVANLAQRWLMDRLVNNTVNVTIGAQTEQFVLLTDGTYNRQPASTNRLDLGGDTYSMKLKDGTVLAFGSSGNIATWSNPAGSTVSFGYDASSPPLLASVSNNFGRTLALNYNGDKQLVSVSDDSGPMRSVFYSYDAAGRLATSTDPLGNVTSHLYTGTGEAAPPGLLTQIFYPSRPAVPFVSNTYDSLGRIAAQANASGSTWTYYFAGYRSEEVDPLGSRHVLYYNPRGKVLFDIADYGGLDLRSTLSYDGLDRLSSATRPGLGFTTYVYDAGLNPWAANVVAVTSFPKPGSFLFPMSTIYTYDPSFNRPTSVTDPLGIVSTMAYDPWIGTLAESTADAGSSPHFNSKARFTYNGRGLLTSSIDPMGVVTRYGYDGFGNRTSVTSDAGPGRLNQTTFIAYNSRGDPVSVTDPRGNVTTATFDDNRRPLAMTSPPTSQAIAGVKTANTYDADGRIIRVQQSANGSVLRTVSATYTRTGQTATTTDAAGNVTHFAYDELDRLSRITDAANRVVQYGYDALGRQIRTSSPAFASPLLALTYTADGQLESFADANGNTTLFAYDGFNRLATATYPGGSTETYTYDANGNILTRKTRAGITIRFGYDTLNRPVTRTAADSPQACDVAPSVTPTVTYRYDLAGRLIGACDNSASIVAAASGGSTVAYTTSYAYDALNRPTGVTWDPAPASASPSPAGPLVTFEHGYNAVNQRVSQSVSNNSWLAYPPAVETTTAYTANSLNQYTAVGGVTPTYDGNGNLASDGTYVLGYDVDSRLSSASGAGNTATYAYDAQGRRKARTVNGTTTISVTDADNREVLEYDGSTGAVLRWYAYGLGPNDVLSQMNVVAGTRATLLPDMLGSIVASIDSASGTLTRSAYQPYGGSAAPASPFGYTGQRRDGETGLYYARARHYSPVLGRFLQPDPIGYAGGGNLYAYVGNDPLNLVDPSGLAAQLAAQAALQAAQAAAAQAVAQANAARIAAGAQPPSSGGGSGGGGAGPAVASPEAGPAPQDVGPTPGPAPAPRPRLPVEGLSFTQVAPMFGTGVGEDVVGASPYDFLAPCLLASGAGGPCGPFRGGGGGGGGRAGNANPQVQTPPIPRDLAATLEALGGGAPRAVPTKKGATQFIFPNGMIMRFDIAPGQYLPGQGPHINLEVPGHGNIHIPLKALP